MSDYIERRRFEEIDISEPFFDSLKRTYKGFAGWYSSRPEREAFVLYNSEGKLSAFLHLKIEHDLVDDCNPKIAADRIVKIATFKVDPHGTKLGERFIKKALDYVIISNASICYATIFKEQTQLIELFEKYGFIEWGIKETDGNTEKVFVKDINNVTGDIYKDYPVFSTSHKKKRLLSIYPDYHTRLFPDSILHNESYDILQDVSYTNSIHKIYICRMAISSLKKGDIVVMYRTSDNKAPAEYRSVATSICVVEEVKRKKDFNSFNDFFDYTKDYSIFDEDELKSWYRSQNVYVLKMTYNAALTRKLTRKRIADECGLPRSRWSFVGLSDYQFNRIISCGGVHENLIVN